MKNEKIKEITSKAIGWESLGRPPFCGPAGWSPESRWSIGPNGERISSHIPVVFREAERVLVSSEKN